MIAGLEAQMLDVKMKSGVRITAVEIIFILSF